MKLILTKEVYSRVREMNERELEEFLKRGEMYVCGNVRLAFIVAENGFAMGLYRDSYDASKMLICTGEEAVKWGEELFRHYLAQSKKVEINK